ncbi:MAG TPA: hypothetical protein VIQ03_10050 [Gammaproteobacteria bacterium]
MNVTDNISIQHRVKLFAVLAMLWLLGATVPAMAIPLTVTGSDGVSITDYRWLIEEDETRHIVPGETCLNGQLADCLSTQFHRSYMTVVAEGRSTDLMPVLDPAKRYYITVLPDAGYSIGGAQVEAGQTSAAITVNALPLPTAQIRVYVFNDNSPINNAPDTPVEQGLEGFSIILEDAGGRYGISAGHQVNDIFGNPLGTTYNPDGSVLAAGDGTITTDAQGFAVIKNLAPGKYGIQAIAPQGQNWVQTSTIEGKKVIDAWVKSNEPPFFTEFGPPGPHVFIGFVQAFTDTSVLSGGATITGQVRTIHNSRPPDFEFFTGWPVPDCWIGLNEVALIGGRGLHASPCNDDSTFAIPNVPAGNYQLVMWDANLDMIFASHNITVGVDGTGSPQDLNLLDIPVFTWFSRLEQYVFLDLNENGIWDSGELPMFEQGTNIRWRDGTVYQSFPTDLSGVAPYDEVFPFFSWLVAEVDYARFKATGATITVDAGGQLVPGEVTNPQPQSENGNGPNRTELGPVLTQAFQGFMGQTNVIEWGKKPYGPNENGGISGIVYYAITRAEDDPSYAAAEPWEPGIPRIQVSLYNDADFNGVIDDNNLDGCPTPADVNNYPFDAVSGVEDFVYMLDTSTPEPCDFIRNPTLGLTFSDGDAIQVTTTDSWDDSIPTGCQGDPFLVDGTTPLDCHDGLRNFNQVRPGVFDGGYAFNGIPAGNYIVGSGEHPAYKTLKEEDRNVDFGDEYIPAPELLPPVCVGNLHTVPNTFSLFDSGEPPYMAGQDTPLCDRKQIYLANGQNAAVDFFMFTQVPIAGHVMGFMLDDLSNEFDPTSPNFGEKYSPPFTPISIRDWTGRVIGRTYSDRWGSYNALVPSTYTVNAPAPSGMSPNMLILCMNDPGPIQDPVTGNMITDPHFKRQYSQFCYTFNFMPGSTTYLDTPVVPLAAFAGPDQFPLDCEFPSGTPVIWSTNGPTMAGPYVATAGETLTLVSAGTVEVPNPDFGQPGEPETISRDFGFGGTEGTVTVNGVAVPVTYWDNDTIQITLSQGGQLDIQRGDNGVRLETGITVTVGGPVIAVSPGGSIQDAIDIAVSGDLILVPPGTYEELVIMWKPVKLQGSGASTVINAVKAPGEKLQAWRTDVESLITNDQVDLLPSQEIGFALPEPDTFNTEEGPGIIVLAKNLSSRRGGFGFVGGQPNARIDGLGVTGADNGGGIFVNGYAHYLQISNNRVFSNNGVFGGGIRVGHPLLTVETLTGLEYQNGFNDHMSIHHNYIAANGGNGGFGGGISLNHGSDRYQVTSNYICGNFSQGHGGGIGHFGLSDNSLIEDNKILFNQSFNQGNPVTGGGVAIIGAPDPNQANLGDGAGSVQIISNLIQGNNAGAGDGAGISLLSVNGEEIRERTVARWHRIDLLNNMVVNNVAGLAGGGISMKDSALVHMVNNTIAHNDSTATAGLAFPPGSPNTSVSQPAGIVSYIHDPALEAAIPSGSSRNRYRGFSNPTMINNIIWHNRSFHFEINPVEDPPVYGLVPDIGAGQPAVFDDFGVMGIAGAFDPRYSILTDTTGYHASNISADPDFIAGYFNGDAGQTIQQMEFTTSISVAPAFDEGGNFIDVRFGPHQPVGDYHLTPAAGSPAVNSGDSGVLTVYGELSQDIDDQARPLGAGVDRGADEVE